jgi:hypothetical protein
MLNLQLREALGHTGIRTNVMATLHDTLSVAP